jgi:hypothetical protein
LSFCSELTFSNLPPSWKPKSRQVREKIEPKKKEVDGVELEKLSLFYSSFEEFELTETTQASRVYQLASQLTSTRRGKKVKHFSFKK